MYPPLLTFLADFDMCIAVKITAEESRGFFGATLGTDDQQFHQNWHLNLFFYFCFAVFYT